MINNESTRFLVPLVFLLTLVVSVLPATSETELQKKIQHARKQVYPALVNISVVVKSYSNGRSRRTIGGGSGVIVSDQGHVLTNYHVASDAIRITCTLPDGEQIRADIVGHDPLTDLSVLKLRTEEREQPNNPLPHASFGNSDDLNVGEYVLAMGNPLSLSSSTTLGVVSNPSRVFTDSLGNEIRIQQLREGEVTGLFTQWIQHDALILPGNSGGPLVNLEGTVVGINELGGNGVGFAIPSELCKRVFERIRDDGEVVRGWAGFKVLPASKMGRDTGVLVSSIRPASPAAKVGLRPGDIIQSMNGKKVTVRFFEEVPAFYRRISEVQPGESLKLTVNRNGTTKEIELNVMAMQDYLGEQIELRSLGLTVREITEPMGIYRKYPDHKGVQITGVRPGESAAQAKPPLERGDVIRSIGETEVEDLERLREFLNELDAFDRLPVSFRRDGNEMLTVLKNENSSDRTGGQLSKPWLGLDAQVLTPPLAKALGHEGASGFRVTRVYDGTNASKAGFQPGDLLLGMNNKPFEARRLQDAQELTRRVENRLIGDEVTFRVLRDGEEKEIDVKLVESPETASDANRYKDQYFEFGVRELIFRDRIREKLDRDLEGAIVTDVKQGGWANLGGLQSGDIIRKIQEKKVSGVEDVENILTNVKKKQPDRVRIFVQRDVSTQFIFLTPDWGDAPPGIGTGGKKGK